MRYFFFFLFSFFVSLAKSSVDWVVPVDERWVYDFVVPDSGSFVDAVKAANARPDKMTRFRIFVKSGYYIVKGDGDSLRILENGKEISFPSPITTLTASNTSIIGESWKDTKIINIPYHEGISITSTLFLRRADSTYIQDLEFWCNFKNDVNAFANRAVAMNEKRCKGNIFKNVSLLSTQDTYYTNDGGTTYLEDCMIHGTVDFICGGGTVFFNSCKLILRPRGKSGSRDVICAPATDKSLRHGYVFNNCAIEGSNEQHGIYCLGRPWKNAPRSVFINTKMSVLSSLAGWCEMHGCIPALFAEYNSMDVDGCLVDISLRKNKFKNRKGKLVKVPYSTTLKRSALPDYSLSSVFPEWSPDKSCVQVAPPHLSMRGFRTVVWDDVPGAYCYAVCIDGDVVDFTRSPFYIVPEGTEEGACFSVRCANFHGGLGAASNEVVYPNR